MKKTLIILCFLASFYNLNTEAKTIESNCDFKSSLTNPPPYNKINIFIYYNYNTLNKRLALIGIPYDLKDLIIQTEKPYKINYTDSTVYVCINSNSIIKYQNTLIKSTSNISINGLNMEKKYKEAIIFNNKITWGQWIQY